MDILIRIINILGNVGGAAGLIWAFSGVISFFKGRKNEDRKMQDDGAEAILYGGLLGVILKAIAEGIIAALNSISF